MCRQYQHGGVGRQWKYLHLLTYSLFGNWNCMRATNFCWCRCVVLNWIMVNATSDSTPTLLEPLLVAASTAALTLPEVLTGLAAATLILVCGLAAWRSWRTRTRVHDYYQQLSELHQSSKAVPDDMPAYLLQGLTIDGVRAWLEENHLLLGYDEALRRGRQRSPNGHDIQEAANGAAIDGLSVCERLSCSDPASRAHVGQANVFVCWSLSTPATSLLEALEGFLADVPTGERSGARRSRHDTFFWICPFSLRQHSPPPPPGCLGPTAEPCEEHLVYLEAIGLIIELIEHTIVLCAERAVSICS